MKVNANVMNLQRSLKININPDKNLNKIDEFAIENKWEIISINFPKLLEDGKALISYQELYEIINDLLIAGTSHKYKESLENILKSFSKKAFENFIKISIKFDKDINNFFFQFNEYFLQIKENFSLIRKIFVKFEKVYYTNQITLWTICNKSFYLVLDHLRISLSSEKKFLEIMINNILFRIYEYRSSALENINIDLGEIKESVKFLWDTQSYKENFHELFLATSESFYNDLSQKLVSSLSIFDYISFVENSLEGETRLVLTYLYDFSLKKLVALVEKKSIIESKERILKKCFEIDDLLSLTWILFLKRVFLLFKKVKLDEEVKKCWMQYISFMSNKIFTIYSKNSKSLFDNLYELKRNIDLTLQEAFLSEEKFRSIAKEGFAKSINLKPNFIADHFSRYIDLMFKECDNEDKKIESNVDEFIVNYLSFLDHFQIS